MEQHHTSEFVHINEEIRTPWFSEALGMSHRPEAARGLDHLVGLNAVSPTSVL